LPVLSPKLRLMHAELVEQRQHEVFDIGVRMCRERQVAIAFELPRGTARDQDRQAVAGPATAAPISNPPITMTWRRPECALSMEQDSTLGAAPPGDHPVARPSPID
jgi:hypothetical protein